MIFHSLRQARSRESIQQRVRNYLKFIFLSKSQEGNNTYEGIYSNFKDARMNQENLTGYVSERWLDIEVLKLEKMINEFKRNPEVAGNYRDRDLLLVIAGMNVKDIKILDIGSGFANTFFFLKTNYKRKIDYVSVELTEIVLFLNQRLHEYDNFKACSLNAMPSEKFDLIYFGSSLQYLEDYEDKLIEICKFKAPMIFISDTPMGNLNTFATVQVNMEDRRIPRWVFSKMDVINLLSRYGYTLVAESIVDWHQQIHNFENFPTNYHQIRNRNLLFECK